MVLVGQLVGQLVWAYEVDLVTVLDLAVSCSFVVCSLALVFICFRCCVVYPLFR